MAQIVNRWNFHHFLPEILQSVSNAAFIAIDFEFLGMPSSRGKDAISLFDALCERYVKIRNAVRRFPPCQLGLACFQECQDGSGSKRYTADVFSITLFKRMGNEFSVVPSTLGFLIQHGFDFNKFATEGVTYCNRNELTKLRDEIVSGVYDFELLEDGLTQRVRMIRLRILSEFVDESDIFPNRCSNDTNCGRRPVIIELFREEEESCGCGECLWDRPLTLLEELVITFLLSEEFFDLEFHFDEERTLLYVGRRPLIFGELDIEERWNRRQESLEKLFNEISGVSRVFYQICERKPPIVGHNCLLDLMYIYNCFVADLPAEYTDWKKEVHEIFPLILDTKILASSTLEDVLIAKEITEFSLPALGDLLTLWPSSTFLPFRISLFVNNEEQIESVFTESQNYHNAAFDALVTGGVFIKLAHLFVITRFSSSLYKPLPLFELIAALRKEIANKIPVPLIDAEYCNLSGADATGFFPDIIEVRSRKHLFWMPSLTAKENVERLLSKLHQCIFGSMEISCEELDYVRKCLICIFGKFRVDVRFGSLRRTLQIATNSPNIYTRVRSFFDTNDEYFLVNNTGHTHKQRLYTPRILSHSVAKESARFSESNNVVPKCFSGRLFIPVLLAVVFFCATRSRNTAITDMARCHTTFTSCDLHHCSSV